MRAFFLTSICLWALAACQHTAQETSESNSLSLKKSANTTSNLDNAIPFDIPQGVEADAFWQAVDQDEDYYDQMNTLLDTNRDNQDWAQVHQAIKAFLDNAHTRPSYKLLAVMTGHEMLKKHLIPINPNSTAYKEALAYYVTDLNNAGYLDIEIMRQSLVKLQGFWSDTQLRTIAQQSLNRKLQKASKYRDYARAMTQVTQNSGTTPSQNEQAYQQKINQIAGEEAADIQRMQSFIASLN